MKLPLKRELNFHFFKGPPKVAKKAPKMEPKWSQLGAKIRRKAFSRGFGSGPENDVKIGPKNGAKREPKWNPNGS